MPGPGGEHEQRTRPPDEGSFATLFSEALTRRRMSLTRLQSTLSTRGHRVSLASLSYWRTGQRRPESFDSLEALAEIETILELAPGRLIDARGPSRRPGPRTSLASDVVPDTVPLDRALASLGLDDWSEHLLEESAHVAADVDATGSMTHLTCRMVLRSLGDGAQHYPIYVFAGQPISEPLVLEHATGARVTGHVLDDGVGLALWRLSLPRPLRSGETAMIESRICLADLGAPDDGCVYHAMRRMSELSVWVRFDPRRVPASCDLLVDEDDARVRTTTVDVSEVHSAHLSLKRFGPGRAGIVFTW